MANLTGGYQILDLSGVTFTSGSETTVSGTYATLEGTNKLIVVHGLTVGSTEYDDLTIPFVVSSTTYYGYIPLYNSGSITIAVASDDGVTVTVAVSNSKTK